MTADDLLKLRDSFIVGRQLFLREATPQCSTGGRPPAWLSSMKPLDGPRQIVKPRSHHKVKLQPRRCRAAKLRRRCRIAGSHPTTNNEFLGPSIDSRLHGERGPNVGQILLDGAQALVLGLRNRHGVGQ